MGRSRYNTVTLIGSTVYLSCQPATPSNPPPAFSDNDVVLQGFYWDVPFTTDNGTWYDTLKAQAESNEFSRFTMMWLPSPSKGHSNSSNPTNGNFNQSVGYDPFDHYDLGRYDSKFSVETRYGHENELRALVDTLNARGIVPIVDLVLNHMAGGYTTEGVTGRYNYQPPDHETFVKPDPTGSNGNSYYNVTAAGEPFSFDWDHGDAGQTADLTRYLTIMSIVAWRLFMITLMARSNPDAPGTEFLTDYEWTVLFLKINKSQPLPAQTPTLGDVVVWIARLGGFLARKGDGMPGTLTLWRGGKRLADLTEGWSLAIKDGRCG